MTLGQICCYVIALLASLSIYVKERIPLSDSSWFGEGLSTLIKIDAMENFREYCLKFRNKPFWDNISTVWL